MKKFKRFGAFALGAIMTFTALPLTAFAHNDEGLEMGILELMPTYLSFTGSIVDMTINDWGMHIRVESETGGVAVFATDHNTHFMGAALEMGQVITGFYYSRNPIPMIYPPQYPVRVITSDIEHAVVIDRFHAVYGMGLENTFSSQSNHLTLNIADDTPIILQDGQNVRALVGAGETLYDSVAEFISGRKLVVTHSIANRMMPAGTIPADVHLSVTVLFEEAVHLGGMGMGLGLDFDDQIEWAYNYGISVEGRMVDALWQEVDGGFYVPFRAIVNLLRFGATVGWDDETRSITVENGTDTIAFAVGSNEFRVGEETVTLTHPAILIRNTTYVPFQFFSQVFGMNNAWMSGGQVFIDNYEMME